MIEIIDSIGFFLPFYIWILVAYLFYLRPPYIAFYGVFYGIGIWINKIIKQIITEFEIQNGEQSALNNV